MITRRTSAPPSFASIYGSACAFFNAVRTLGILSSSSNCFEWNWKCHFWIPWPQNPMMDTLQTISDDLGPSLRKDMILTSFWPPSWISAILNCCMKLKMSFLNSFTPKTLWWTHYRPYLTIWVRHWRKSLIFDAILAAILNFRHIGMGHEFENNIFEFLDPKNPMMGIIQPIYDAHGWCYFEKSHF